MQQTIQESTTVVTSRRMNNGTCGFIHNQQVFVFEDNIERQGFGFPFSTCLQLCLDIEGVTFLELVPRPELLPIHQQLPCLDPVLKPSP